MEEATILVAGLPGNTGTGATKFHDERDILVAPEQHFAARLLSRPSQSAALFLVSPPKSVASRIGSTAGAGAITGAHSPSAANKPPSEAPCYNWCSSFLNRVRWFDSGRGHPRLVSVRNRRSGRYRLHACRSTT
jgi:hypothetical protein